MNETAQRPFTIGSVLGQAIDIFKKNAAVILVMVFCMQALFLFQDIFSLQLSCSWVGFWLYFVALAVYFLFFIMVICVVQRKASGKDVFSQETLLVGVKKFWPFIGASIIYYAAALVGGFFFIIPGVYLFVVFSLALYTLVLEEISIIGAFKKSARMVKSSFFEMFAIGCIMNFVFFGCGVLFALANYFWPKHILVQSVWLVINSILWAFYIAIHVAAYLQLSEVRQEDLQTNPIVSKKTDGLIAGAIIFLIIIVFMGLILLGFKAASSRSGVCPFSKGPIIEETSTFTEEDHLDPVDQTSRIIDKDEFYFYIPSNIDANKEYPLIITLSSTPGGKDIFDSVMPAAEQRKWFVYAFKRDANELSGYKAARIILRHINEILDIYPVYQSDHVLAGFSAGGMQSHEILCHYPETFSAIIVNTGMLNDSFTTTRLHEHPKNRIAVLLASLTDFRYNEMQQGKKILESLEWETKWMEFSGGHVVAPTETFLEAMVWLEKGLELPNRGEGEMPSFPLTSKTDAPLNGLVKEHYPNGNVSVEVNFVNGKREGLFRSFYEDGILWSEVNYRDNQKHGLMTVYNNDGSIQSKVNYEDGLRNGSYDFYRDEKNLSYSLVYDKGELIQKKVYNASGGVLSEQNFLNGKQEGLQKFYGRNGKVIAQMRYHEDENVTPSMVISKKLEKLAEKIFGK